MARNIERPLKQKTIGILGGSSNEATREYYVQINALANERLGGWDNAEILISSVNFGNIECFVRQNRWDDARDYMATHIDRLERAGADVIICVSNTLHKVVEPLMSTRKTAFIHIADPTGAAIQKAGLKRIALLGTMATMLSPEYAARYTEKFGVELITPVQSDKEIVDRIIFDELVRNKILDDSRKEYLRIVEEMKKRGAEGVILGCTEIFLLIDAEHLPGYPVFNTASLHVEAVVDFALAECAEAGLTTSVDKLSIAK